LCQKGLKITAEIKELAHECGPMAIKELLERGYGKAMQPIQGTVDYGIIQQLAELFKENAGNTLGQEIARRAALPPPRPH